MPAWVIFAEIGASIALHEVGKWLSDPIKPQTPRAFSDLPQTALGTVKPFVFGRTRISRPALVWWGGARAKGNTIDVFTKDEIQGTSIHDTDENGVEPPNRFGTNLLFVVGIPQSPIQAATGARLVGVWFDNSKLECNLGDGDNLHVLQGGAVSFAGTVGQITFHAGGSTQQLSDNTIHADDADLSPIYRFMRRHFGLNSDEIAHFGSYRNLMVVEFTGDHTFTLLDQGNIDTGQILTSYVFGPTTTLPNIALEVFTRSAVFTNATFANGDANPADVAYQVLKSPWALLDVDPAKIDTGAFLSLAVTLAAEGNGMSGVFDAAEGGKSLLQKIATQAGCVFYEDPVNRVISCKAIRNDYNIATIPYFNVSHVVDVERYIVGGWPDLIDRFEVKFVNRELDYTDDIAVAFNQASAVQQDASTDSGQPGGKVRSTQVDYPYASNATLAKALAERDLNALSQPLAQLRIVFNRRIDLHGTSNAAQLRPGATFKLSLTDHYINDVVFRVTNVDPGQHGDSKVTVDAVTDVFFAATAGFQPPGQVLLVPHPYPLLHRYFTETPRWFQKKMFDVGELPNADTQRIFALARPSDSASDFSVSTAKVSSTFSFPTQLDIPSSPFMFSGKVATLYPRTADPYDTTTGLVISSLFPDDATVAAALIFPVSAADNASDGLGMVIVGGEIVLYESVTDLGGSPKQLRLNNVWRAALDTVPKDHAVGEDVYFVINGIYQLHVGDRGWPGGSVRATMIPRLGTFTGSGKEPSDTITIKSRSVLPMRCAALALAGKNMLGTQGIPAIAGQFTKVSLLEEGVDVFAFHRNRLTATIVRGDAADESPDEVGITYRVQAQKVAGTAQLIATVIPANPFVGGQGYTIGPAGHGQIDLIVQTVRTVQTGETGIGFPVGTTIANWDSPSVRITAPPWRNLLANSRFDYNAIAPGWAVQSGSCGVGNDASSIPRDATGFYLKATSSVGTPQIKQIVDISGYVPRKYQARLVYYQRNLGSDANDTATVTLDPLDSSNVVLAGSATQTLTPPTAVWSRTNLSIAALPANTAKLAVTAQLNEVATGGTTTAESALTEFELICGQHLYDQLSNPSFEAGTTVSWTNVTNSFVVDTTSASPSANYARGGAFAASAIRQDFALPAGWEVGSTVVLRCWRMQTIASDTGRVRLQAIDGGGAATTLDDTTVENLSTLSQWVKRRLTGAVPVGTVSIRVLLDAVRTGGAGNSGACFDDLVLTIHKDLDPDDEHILTFDTPTVQPVPAVWQDWVVALQTQFEAGLLDPVIFAGSDPSWNPGRFQTIKMHWSDDVARAAGTRIGQFGAGVTSIGGYAFTRQSGAGALDFQTFLETASSRFMSPTSADAFTVIVLFQVDETGFAASCGLCGRRDSSSGWDLAIDATGHVAAVVQGLSGTKTATRPGTTVHDGAWHLAAITYDPVAQTITVSDERGDTSTSTAAGLGEIANISDACQFRIGRGRSTIDTIPGFIGRVWCFPGVALTSAQRLAHWNYAKDPSALLTAYTRTAAAIVPIAPSSAGDQAVVMSADQVALTYRASLASDGGTGFGLAVGRAAANLIPSWDFASASWVVEVGTTLVQGTTDITGRPHGVQVNGNAAHGFKVAGIATGAAAAVLSTSFWLRSISGSTSLDITLLTSADAVESTQTVVLTTLWQRFDLVWSWSGATATSKFRFRSNSGAIVFEIAQPTWCGNTSGGATSPIYPALIPLPASTHGDYNATAAITLPTQFNREGEIVAEGTASISGWSFPATGTLVNVWNGVNNKNRRELQALTAGSDTVRLAHSDGTPATVNSDKIYSSTWHTRVWKMRGRWNALGLLDVTAGVFAQVTTEDNIAPTPSEGGAGRAAIWTNDTTQATTIQIGAGTAAPEDVILRRVMVRARESKLA